MGNWTLAAVSWRAEVKRTLLSSAVKPLGTSDGGVIGQAPGLPALGRHDEDVEVAEAVGGEGDRSSVVAPDRGVVVGLADRQGEGLAARGRDLIDVALVAEQDRPAVGRDGRIPQPERMVLGRERKGPGQDGRQEQGQRGRISERIGGKSAWIPPINRENLLI